MAPLFVKPLCLKCHAKQGYKEDDILNTFFIDNKKFKKEFKPEEIFNNKAIVKVLESIKWVGYGIVAVSGFILILIGGVLLERKRLSLEISNEKLKAVIVERQKAEEKILVQNTELKEALSKVKLLSGFIPICASCKKIRDDNGYWNQIKLYIKNHSEAEFTHSICPKCAKKLYPEIYDR